MPDPVLRIPVDDAAFQRYLDAFQRYQTQLQDQPEMWEESNAAVRDGVAANLALADAIGASVAAAVRLGDQQARNAQQRERDAQRQDAEQKRASSWRRAAIDHVQELSRTTASVVRSLGGFARDGTAGGLFGMVSGLGRQLGGSLGGIVNLTGEALNANYIANNAISDKGNFARGIGATISQQEGFQTQLGRYVNTDQGIDAVMNARGNPAATAGFRMLGVDFTKGSNADVYAETLRAQVRLAERNMDKNGNIRFYATDPRGGSAYGTSHEDLNRLVAADRAGGLEQAIKEAVSFKSPADKLIDASTKSAVATDKLATIMTDDTQVSLTTLNAGTNKLTEALTKLSGDVENITSLLSFKWLAPNVSGTPAGQEQWARDHPWLNMFGIHPSGGARAETPGLSPDQWARDHPTLNSIGIVSRNAPDVQAYRGMASALRRYGLSDAVSFGAAAGAIAESHGNPNAYNPKTGAFGIGQWIGDRKRALLSMATRDHVDPHDINEQLKFLVYELRGGDAGGKSVLRARSIQEALHAYVYNFMRPQGAHNEHIGDAVSDERRGTTIMRSAGAGSANVQVNVKVSAPPGHQTAVTANGAARGG